MWWAHSQKGQPPDNWHPLNIHATTVAEKAACFASAFGSADCAAAAGMLHDLGKASPAFQAYLLHENGIDNAWTQANYQGRSEHAWVGACITDQRMTRPHFPLGRPLAYVVDGHHAGLPDWQAADEGTASLRYHLSEKQP